MTNGAAVLELAPPVNGSTTAKTAPPQFESAMPARVLVVDDQVTNIQIVGSILGNLDFEIIPASDGATALKRLALRKPDLILLDLLMPDMDGCEVCYQVKQNREWRDIPVIFLSAADDKDLIVRALEAGGVDYITKPFNHAELISRVRTQLALKNARDRLKQLAEDKDELLGILAHDLKNHVGGMKMSAEIMRGQIEKLNDDRLNKLSENILRSSSQLLAFVKEFLANAAADYGFSAKIAPVNFVNVANNVIQQHLVAAKQKNLEIKTEFSIEDSMVLADASALEQVLDNLISNAIKFSPSGRKIFVSLKPNLTHVECIVRDEGPGFTEEDKSRMFHRYTRLSARPTGGEPSTGLGLSIVRKLVRAMHGELILESEPGRGAKFTIQLPKQT
jgi:two-component system sensor histidine kinase/response regulator